MAKRFTATEKWEDPWFRDLAPAAKLAYIYMLDRCDHAGVIDLDTRLAEFCIGASVDWNALLGEERIRHLGGSKYWLVKFCQFQYSKGLKPGNYHYDSVIAILEKHSLITDLPEGLYRPSSGSKDKNKEIKGGVGGKARKQFSPPSVEDVSAYVAEKGYSFDPEAFVAHYAARNWYLNNNRKMADWKAACVTWQKNSTRYQKQDASSRPKDVDLRL